MVLHYVRDFIKVYTKGVKNCKPLHVGMMVEAGSAIPRHPALVMIAPLFFLDVLSGWA